MLASAVRGQLEAPERLLGIDDNHVGLGRWGKRSERVGRRPGRGGGSRVDDAGQRPEKGRDRRVAPIFHRGRERGKRVSPSVRTRRPDNVECPSQERQNDRVDLGLGRLSSVLGEEEELCFDHIVQEVSHRL